MSSPTAANVPAAERHPQALAGRSMDGRTTYPDGVTWGMRLEPAPLYSLLDEAVSRAPEAPCANFLGRNFTYEDIFRDVLKVAASLQALGLKKGTRVGLLMPNCPAFIVYYFAILKAGGTVVNYNPLYTVEELAYQIRDSETEIMVTLDLKLLFDKVEALLTDRTLTRAIVCSFTEQLPAAKSVLFRLFKSRELAHVATSREADRIDLAHEFKSRGGIFTPVPIDPIADIAVLQYTGGTTGTPKGAMLTHANVLINVQQVRAWAPELEYGKERVLGALPFFHVFAMTVVMNLGIAVGAEIVIMPRFNLEEALTLISKSRPTIMPGVPTLFNAIINHPRAQGIDFSSLSFCLSGGAPLPLEIKSRFEETTGCALVEGYGLSEASPVVTCNPIKGPVKPGSIGLPLPGTQISLRDLSNPERVVAAGERGEICVKGPQVMKGYWRKPAETAAQFVGDWLRTGDVGIVDEEGFYFIVDRIKDLIICSGYNVYPRRIEEAIYAHAAVEEVTVIGIPDKYRGEAPMAFIKLKAGAQATADDILKHLTPKISKLEMPAAIEFRDSLPKTMIGKLSKKELKSEMTKQV